MYDKNNVFAKIVRGEIPSKKVMENDYAMSFYDVNPCFEKHVLVIPKGEYENILDFANDLATGELKDVYEVKFVQAAHWLISRECLERVGGFSPSFPHYGEDNNFCNRAQYPILSRLVLSRRQKRYTMQTPNLL